MKKDIENINDIKKLVNNFYIKVVPDDLLGYIFEEVAQTDWTHHFPKMYDFWGTILLEDGTYKGNPILRHLDLDKEVNLLPEHFAHWVSLFTETVDEYFEGEIAQKAKNKAESIAAIMENKIKLNRY